MVNSNVSNNNWVKWVLSLLLAIIGFLIISQITIYKEMTTDNTKAIEMVKMNINHNTQNIAVINDRLIMIQKTLDEIKKEIKK